METDQYLPVVSRQGQRSDEGNAQEKFQSEGTLLYDSRTMDAYFYSLIKTHRPAQRVNFTVCVLFKKFNQNFGKTLVGMQTVTKELISFYM